MPDLHQQAGFVPRHWIGVYKWWRLISQSPWGFFLAYPPEERGTHTLIIGATGSGKTVLCHHLIVQEIQQGHSICVLDLRGDFVAAVVELCARFGVDPRKVLLLDLRAKGPQATFNPLFGAGEPYYRALNVLDVIASESESWGVQLSETLRNGLLLLAESGQPLTRLESLLFDRHFRLTCLEACKSESVVAFWQRFDELSADRQTAFAGPVLNKLSPLLATSTLRAILGGSNPVDLGKHLNTPGSITLVSLAVDELHASGKMMGRLVLASICREVFARVETQESKRNPIRLYVDEFEHFGMTEFETILAEGRRFGFSAVLAHQTLAQLSPRMRSMILNNVGAKFVFRCGREDSAVLSKDLTGDPKAFDFNEFGVGEAVMWRRGQGSTEIEVNEPLVQDVGRRSDAARLFVKHIRQRETAFEMPTNGVSRADGPVEPFNGQDSLSGEPQNPRKGNGSDLGDWLCD